MINQIKEKIEHAKNIAIFGHVNTDGDCVGSMCAFFNLLNSLGKNVEMFLDCEVPEYLKAVPGADKINSTNFNKANFDLLISVDTSSAKRLGEYGDTFKKFENTLLVDHHISNEKYAKICAIDGTAPACGEVLTCLMEKCGYEIDKATATCLYAAIISDTNNFTTNNTRKETFNVAGRLIDYGAEFSKIIYSVQKVKTYSQVKMAGFMAQNVKMKNGFAYLIVREKDLKKLNAKTSDISKFLSLIVDIQGVKITAVFKQRGKDFYTVSFRSLEQYNVLNIASKFGGGGHKNAAAFEFNGVLTSLKKQVFLACEEEIKRVDSDAK